MKFSAATTHTLIATIFTLSSAIEAHADACTARVAAMFQAGPLDAYERPSHRHEKQVLNAAGIVNFTFTSIIDTPLRSISGIKGGDMTLTIDDDTWTGPSADGPWTPSENNMQKDRKPWHLALQAQQAKNLTNTECDDAAKLDGKEVIKLRYSTKTDPNPDMNNAFFGSTDTAYIDPETQLLLRLEQTGFFSSWLPEPGTDTHVTLFTYDPTIQIETPD